VATGGGRVEAPPTLQPTSPPGAAVQPTSPLGAAVQFDGISKRFPGVVALSGVSFPVARGSCHALCGENGAGKSTLAKILGGVYVPDEGRILLDGAAVRFASPRDAMAAGIAIVHQEPAFCRNLSVAENLCLSALPRRGPMVDRAALRARARAILDSVDLDLDVDRAVERLTPGQRQLLQIAAAAGSGARVILFDEPTSSLGEHEAAQLFALIARVRAQGATCLYVSHRLSEIFRLCDTVTVLRDGTHVATRPLAGLDERSLVQMMIGRRLEAVTPEHLGKAPGPERLEVEGLSSPGRFEDVTFSVRAGEVVGLGGLVGAGRSEVAQALFGLDPRATGRVLIDGSPARLHDPAGALRLGFGLVPEDRQRQGLVLLLGGRANTTLPILDRLARLTWVRRRAEEALVEDHFAKLRVRSPHIDFPVAGLSGGNQQKIVMARWLAARCRILILDEPTRGVDVGAKAEIHALIDRLAADGSAVLLISSEMPELLALSTRIVVLRGGRVVGELARAEASEESLAHLMTGVDPAPAAREAEAAVAEARG
jgi:ABC-type sugar transport system ATPase subunit